MIRNIFALALLLAVVFLPNTLHAASVLGSIHRGTVTDQGDCTNINGKLMAVYRSATSQGISFVFKRGETRLTPNWVTPTDGQNVLVLLGPRVTCTKSNGSSSEERLARYYSVSGAVRPTQQVTQTPQTPQGGAQGGGSAGIQRAPNVLPGVYAPFGTVRTVPNYTVPNYTVPNSGLPSYFGGSNPPGYSGGGQQIIQEMDTSMLQYIRGLSQ